MCLAHPTGAARLAAVVRAIGVMRARIAEPLSLRKLAHAAMLSPFHFHRVFRHVTATTPARYLAALRMAEAKRLLVRSPLSITEVCGAVGYASLSTFTNQFTRMVGMSPRSFRELMAELGDRPIVELLDPLTARAGADRLGYGGDPGIDTGPTGTIDGGPVGTIAGGPAGGGLAIVGLFDSGVPARRPAACTLVSSPGLAMLGPYSRRGLPAAGHPVRPDCDGRAGAG